MCSPDAFRSPQQATNARQTTCCYQEKAFRKGEDSMNRQSSKGGALEELQNVKAGDIPTTTFGKTGIQVSIVAQGGARMDLHPDVQTAAAHVRRVYDLGVTYFDCARA